MDKITPIVKTTGDISISGKYIPWAKNRIEQLISIQSDTYIVRKYTLTDLSTGKPIDVDITIQISPPFSYIFISTGGSIQTFGGVTKDDLNILNYSENSGKNSMIYFFKKGTSGFLPSTELYNTYSSVKYQSTNGNIVNQTHYIYGMQYSGLMSQYVQTMLGANMKVEYKSELKDCDIIYTHSNNDKYLINISNNGVCYRKILMTTFKGQDIPDGIRITNFSINKILTFSTISPALQIGLNDSTISSPSYKNSFHGWSANKKGDIIQVVTFNQFTGLYSRFRININESGVDLTATFTNVESGYYVFDSRVSLYSPTFENNKYYKAKQGELRLNTLIDSGFNPLVDGEHNCPIHVYYDNLDNEIVLRHYWKCETLPQMISGSVTNFNDFFTSSFSDSNGIYTMGYPVVDNTWLQQNGVNIIVNKTDSLFNKKITHGFYFNTSELKVDYLGDNNISREFTNSGSKTYSPSTILKDIKSSNLSFYNTYKEFSIGNYIDPINNTITQINITQNSNIIYQKLIELSKKIRDFNVLFANIGANTVNYQINNSVFPFIKLYEFFNPRCPVYLYSIDSGIQTLFDYFISNTVNTNYTNIKTNINSAYTQITATDISNIINQLNSIINNFDDIYQWNMATLNGNIATINSNISSLNVKINNFNNDINNALSELSISDISTFNSNLDDFNSKSKQLTEDFSDVDCGSRGVQLTTLREFTDTIAITDEFMTIIDYKIVTTTYSIGNEISSVLYKSNNSIDNKIKNFQTLSGNYSHLSSINLNNTTKQYNNFKHYFTGMNNKVKLNNYIMLYDNRITNRLRFYKRVKEVLQSNSSVISDTNHVPFESIVRNEAHTIITHNSVNYNLDYVVPSNPGIDIDCVQITLGLDFTRTFVLNVDLNSTIIDSNKNEYDIKSQNFITDNSDIEVNITNNFKQINKYEVINLLMSNDYSYNTVFMDLTDDYFDNNLIINNKQTLLYFINTMDSLNNKYVISPQMSIYNEFLTNLTNISEYSIVNYPVNYVGRAF